ncbi:MAG: hypothetical protein HC850_15140 [Rhodomicrobium sp.]|nr:hypothetical protein [Rhodomicrobium sp.]
MAMMAASGAQAQDEALAASGPPVAMALLVDSDTDRCYDRGMSPPSSGWPA